jgi:hypothetical protein
MTKVVSVLIRAESIRGECPIKGLISFSCTIILTNVYIYAYMVKGGFHGAVIQIRNNDENPEQD